MCNVSIAVCIDVGWNYNHTLRSMCTMLRECRWRTPSRIWKTTSLAFSSGSGSTAMTRNSSPPNALWVRGERGGKEEGREDGERRKRGEERGEERGGREIGREQEEGKWVGDTKMKFQRPQKYVRPLHATPLPQKCSRNFCVETFIWLQIPGAPSGRVLSAVSWSKRSKPL